MSNGNQTSTNTSVYTSSNTSFYDKHASALELKFVNNNGLLKFSPINQEFVGKEPKKGDKIYDYESATNVLISGIDAKRLLDAIEADSYEEDAMTNTSIVIQTETATFTRTLSILKPGTTRLSTMKERWNGYILSIVQEHGKDGKMTVIHCFNPSNYAFKNAKKEVTEYETHPEFDLFVEWLKAVVQVAVGGYRHSVNLVTSKLNIGRTSNSNNQRTRNTPTVVDDETGDEDVSKTSTALAAEDEFGG